MLGVLLIPQIGAAEVRTLGKQSPEEQYDALILEPEESEPLVIDFNRLLDASTENDDVLVTGSLESLTITFDGSTIESGSSEDDFVQLKGSTRIAKYREALPAALKESLAKFEHQETRFGDLRKIKQVIIEAYHSRGYPLMSVVIPPQAITDDELAITIHEFRLGDIDYQWRQADESYTNESDRFTSDDNLQKAFSGLEALPVLAKDDLSSAVDYLNANPYRQVKIVFEPGADPNETNVNVLIDENRPWNLSSSYNNHATESSGTHRYSVGATFGNLPVEDAQLALRGTYGDNRQEFQSYSVIFTKPTRAGHTFTLNGSYSDTASSNIPGISSASRTTTVIGSYQIPIGNLGPVDFSSTHSLSYRRFERDSFFDDTLVGGASFESVLVTTGGSVAWKNGNVGHKIDLNVTASVSGLASENTTEGFQAFHNNNGDATYFFSVVNYARQQGFTGEWLKNWNTTTQVSLQQASGITAGSDNFSLGGPGVLKAYASGEAAGDEGWFVTQTLAAPPIQPQSVVFKQMQVSGFVEVGHADGRTTTGQKLWDAGLAVTLSIAGGASCNLTYSLAGTDGTSTEADEKQLFLGCSYQY